MAFTQQEQPVPIFYGGISSTSSVAVPLATGFDWVLTHVGFTYVANVNQVLSIFDEASKYITQFIAPYAPTATGYSSFSWDGFAAIGPRTALSLSIADAPATVWVAGVAFSPSTALHV